MSQTDLPLRAYQASYGLRLNQLSIVVVEQDRRLRSLMQSSLSQMRPAKLRLFADADEALFRMHQLPPSLVLCNYSGKPMDGCELAWKMRHVASMPLCFVPIIMMAQGATISMVQDAMRCGATLVVALPVSPQILKIRIQALCGDSRCFRLVEEQYVLETKPDGESDGKEEVNPSQENPSRAIP